jgi:hypothetical protein
MCPLATASGLIINVLFVAILFFVFKFCAKVDFFLNLNKEISSLGLLFARLTVLLSYNLKLSFI